MRRVLVANSTLLVVVSMLTGGPVAAQMSLGIGGGIVSAKFVGDDTNTLDIDSETGISFGAWLGLPIGSRLAVVPGAHYVQKGASSTEPGIGTASIELSYFEIPLLLSASLTPPDSPMGFSVFAGPSIAFEVGCTITGQSGSASVSDDCDPASDDDRQTLDVGAIIGGGLQFPLNESLGLMISGGVDIGLRTLDTSASAEDVKNRAFFGSAGVVIPIGD